MQHRRKAAEEAAGRSFRLSGYRFDKAADVRRCPQCGHVIPKAEDEPDAIATKDWFYVEVKESGNDGRFSFRDFTEIQLKRLEEHEGYIYLVLRDPKNPRAPKGAGAFLLEWQYCKAFMADLSQQGHQSIRLESTPKSPGARQLLAEYELPWIVGHGDEPGYWQIPTTFRRPDDHSVCRVYQPRII